jgi:hypothetical protein
MIPKNEFDVFYEVWARNHREDNKNLIRYYAKYERLGYLPQKDLSDMNQIQTKYGEHVITLIIPYIKESAHKINDRVQ